MVCLEYAPDFRSFFRKFKENAEQNGQNSTERIPGMRIFVILMTIFLLGRRSTNI